ncbi:DUF2933 domain-containing protein [Cupriavidus pauculus]|uniref:DUF2933 domain-containing protein n=1 Tax=Cupriavidus pauculus TaxID=82633 RepID=UPI000AD47FAB|nr:DUF2933 domain-containing protein [Cupriavidus pauculus]
MKAKHSQSTHHGASAGQVRRLGWSLRWALILGTMAMIATIALWMPRWSAVASWLPFALVLLCPLMHLFHGGHGRSAPSRDGDPVDGQRHD